MREHHRKWSRESLHLWQRSSYRNNICICYQNTDHFVQIYICSYVLVYSVLEFLFSDSIVLLIPYHAILFSSEDFIFPMMSEIGGAGAGVQTKLTGTGK